MSILSFYSYLALNVETDIISAVFSDSVYSEILHFSPKCLADRRQKTIIEEK